MKTRDKQGRYFSLRRLIHFILLSVFATVLIFIFLVAYNWYSTYQIQIIRRPLFNPLIEGSIVLVKPAIAKELVRREGQASWYGSADSECLGCNAKRIMANGQTLDDTKNTVACRVGDSCKQFPVGSKVKIINLDNMMTTTAWVTDTGGLRPGRILDVSKAVKGHLNMAGLANVQVTRID